MTKNIKRKERGLCGRIQLSGGEYNIIIDGQIATKAQAIAFAKAEIKEWQKFIKDMK